MDVAAVPLTTFTHVEIADYCFEPMAANLWKCKFCQKLRKCERSKNGPGNLSNHITGQHGDVFGDFIAQVKAATKQGLVQSKVSIVFIDKKVQNMYGWMDFMMDYDIPFSRAEDKGYLKTSKLQKVDHRTLKKYFVQMGLLVEKKVAHQN